MLLLFLSCIIINSHICKYVYNTTEPSIIIDIIPHYNDINNIDLYYNNMRYSGHDIIELIPTQNTTDLLLYINYKTHHSNRTDEPFVYLFVVHSRTVGVNGSRQN